MMKMTTGEGYDINEVYQNIIEGLSAAVLLFNKDLKLLYINPAGEMLLDSSESRLSGMDIGEILASDKDLVKHVLQCLDSFQPFTERAVELSKPPHRAVIVDCVVTPLLDSEQVTSILIELTQLDRNLRIAREGNQIQQNIAIRTLIRGMAHEIKNPLGGIRGAAQLLERELKTADLKEYTDIIIGEADRLRNLVNRLLGPNALPQKRLINIHEIIERVRQLVEVEKPIGVRIRKDYDPSIPEIIADRDQLIQAILNIVGNAAQAIDERSSSAKENKQQGNIVLRTRTIRHFTIGSERHKLVCEVSIIDDGPGISEELQESIFFPMVTTRPEGSGLGLSIAESLIQQNGGLIQCESKPGNTIFRILLPICEGKQDEHSVTEH